MKTRHLPIQVLLAVALLAVFTALPSCRKKEPRVTYAWWLTEEYAPTETEIAGMPVVQIDPGWVKASVLSLDRLSPEGRAYLETRTKEMGRMVGFDLTGDFNGDKREDRALAGVYESTVGVRGRFLLILTRAENGGWEKADLEVISDRPGFTTLWYSDGDLSWLDCFECDGYPHVRWKDGRYFLYYPDEGEGEDDGAAADGAASVGASTAPVVEDGDDDSAGGKERP